MCLLKAARERRHFDMLIAPLRDGAHFVANAAHCRLDRVPEHAR